MSLARWGFLRFCCRNQVGTPPTCGEECAFEGWCSPKGLKVQGGKEVLCQLGRSWSDRVLLGVDIMPRVGSKFQDQRLQHRWRRILRKRKWLRSWIDLYKASENEARFSFRSSDCIFGALGAFGSIRSSMFLQAAHKIHDMEISEDFEERLEMPDHAELDSSVLEPDTGRPTIPSRVWIITVETDSTCWILRVTYCEIIYNIYTCPFDKQ